MKRKAVSGLLILMSVFTMGINPISTFAEDTDTTATVTTQDVTTAGSQEATVTYKQESAFTVTIPKEITLSSDKTASYNVKVQGDISGNETITVTPDATVTLSDANGKTDVTGNITQAVTSFASTDVNTVEGASTTGSITANDLTAGSWSGQFNFTIAKTKADSVGADVTLTADNLDTYSIAKTGDVVIPEYVTESNGTKHKVVAIGNAFQYAATLNSITIPNTVKSIGNDAFLMCSGLESITIPSSVNSIGNDAFSDCENLTNINLGNVVSIGNNAFVRCNSLSSITIPGSVTEIGANAFSSAAIVNVTFGETNGWYVGASAGEKTTALTSSDVGNTTTAARLLRSDYLASYWTR